MTLVSCSPPASSQRPVQPATPALRSRVPPADPSKYRSVLDARDWQNPYLVVHANGIDARPISAETEAARMSPAEVVGYLEKLPSIAWPYGLVVVVQESGVRAPGDNAQIRKNAEELQRLVAENWGESGIVAFGLERASTKLQLSDFRFARLSGPSRGNAAKVRQHQLPLPLASHPLNRVASHRAPGRLQRGID